MFKYSKPERTVQIGFEDGQQLTLEEAKVVALVNVGDELERLQRKVSALTDLLARK